MVKVECEGCKAPYEIDERRIPATGLKMRCPKCGTSVLVQKPGGVAPAPGLPAPPAPPAAPRAPTQVGGFANPGFGALDPFGDDDGGGGVDLPAAVVPETIDLPAAMAPRPPVAPPRPPPAPPAAPRPAP